MTEAPKEWNREANEGPPESMKKFADLYLALDQTTRTGEKVEALARYLSDAPPRDAAWAVYFLIGRKPRQAVSARKLTTWAIELAGIPEWLFGESYDAVGDLAETIALLVPPSGVSSDRPLSEWIEEWLLPLRDKDEPTQRQEVLKAWAEMDTRQLFVSNKLITGAFRVGVSHQLVVRALAQVSSLDAKTVAHRLMGDWVPTREFYASLTSLEQRDEELSRPYPFFLAHMLEDEPEELGAFDEWQVEWKWDGIRAQLIRRMGEVFVWSRGEELVTDRYPELRAAGQLIPAGTVLDGEILPWSADTPLPFAELQRRIGRKSLGRKLLEQVPVVLMAYDLLEFGGNDVRQHPLADRRGHLETIVAGAASPALLISPVVHAESWENLTRLRAGSRERRVEGMMLKRRSSPYGVGRQRGDWWKWKIEPYTIDAVLIYAQPGSGKRASLFTDYTFGVWNEGRLVPVAKAYSGLTDSEIREVDGFVRRNTIEKFGPVRTVKPELVFELAFEAIAASSRHKSGIAVRFPRIKTWRVDKRPEEADSLATLLSLLPRATQPRE
jgi:DNA ligase-1